MLGLFLVVLWLAGGASRGDVAGQIIVRSAAFVTLAVLAVVGRWPAAGYARPVGFVLAAAVLIAAVQLLPLPAGLHVVLPGRDMLDGTPVMESGGRWSLVPGGTLNALVALIVPVTVLALLAVSTTAERARLPGIVLALAVASMLVGLLQFSGAGFDNPLVNDSLGGVSGTFANHNHFALFLALGCLVLPVWMFREGERLGWRGPIGLGLLLLFALMILASGSRAGMTVGALAIAIAGVLLWPRLRRELRNAPRWVLPTAVAVAVALLAVLVIASVATDRAVSIQRSLALDVEQDMRSRALPTVWHMTQTSFPAGLGLGSFEAAFRMNEPFALLKPTYFNQTHNDLIAVVLDAGLPGLLLLVAAAAWWVWASIRAWRRPACQRSVLARLGSAMLLLIVLASVVDYPARTPLIMAMIVIAAVWLADQPKRDGVLALRHPGQHL